MGPPPPHRTQLAASAWEALGPRLGAAALRGARRDPEPWLLCTRSSAAIHGEEVSSACWCKFRGLFPPGSASPPSPSPVCAGATVSRGPVGPSGPVTDNPMAHSPRPCLSLLRLPLQRGLPGYTGPPSNHHPSDPTLFSSWHQPLTEVVDVLAA